MSGYEKYEEDIIILSGFNELTYETKRVLLSDFTNPHIDLKKHEKFLIKTLADGVYNNVSGKFYDRAYRDGVLRGLAEKGVKCVTYFSDGYPDSLKNIPSPPVMLYCKGDISLLKTNCFSVVGSRRASPKTLADCKKIAGELTLAFTVVSGVADGSDSAAVCGALDCGGKVICVLANGFDRVYPASAANLYRTVAGKGLLISEYPPDAVCKPYHFPVRNRIIAGLSRGVLVVAAAEKSGALITADYAADYGRDVFAFPYGIGSPAGAGCNALIKNGAYLTENILDIFLKYGLDCNTQNRPRLSEEENEVYNVIKSTGQAFLPQIAQKLGKPSFRLIPLLSSLEIKGLIVRLGGNRYSVI